MESSVSYLKCLSYYIADDKYTFLVQDIDDAAFEYEEAITNSDTSASLFTKYENLYSILNEHTTKLKKYFKNFDADDFIKNELVIEDKINEGVLQNLEKEIIKAYMYEKHLLDYYGTTSLFSKISKNVLSKQGIVYDNLLPVDFAMQGLKNEISTDKNTVNIYVYTNGTISEKFDSSLSKISFNALKDTSGFDWSAKGYDVNMSLENRFNFPIGRDEDEEGVESVPVEKTYEDEIIDGLVFDVQNNDFTSILSNFKFDEFELNLDILLDSENNAYIQDFNRLIFILCIIVVQIRENEKEDSDDSSLDIIESRVQRIKSDIKSKLAEQGIENIKGFLQSADVPPILEKLVSLYPRTKDFCYKTDEEKKTIYLSVLGEVLSADFEILTDEKENELLVESSCKRIEVDVSPFVESTMKKTIVLAQRESSKAEVSKISQERNIDVSAGLQSDEDSNQKISQGMESEQYENIEKDMPNTDNVEKAPHRIENIELNLSRANNIDKSISDNFPNEEELDTNNSQEKSSTNTAKINDDESDDAEEDKDKKSPMPWWGITLLAVGGTVFVGTIGYAIYTKTCGAKPRVDGGEYEGDKSDNNDESIDLQDNELNTSEIPLSLFGHSVSSSLGKDDKKLLKHLKELDKIKTETGEEPKVIPSTGIITDVLMREKEQWKLSNEERKDLLTFFADEMKNEEYLINYNDYKSLKKIDHYRLCKVLNVLHTYYYEKDNEKLVQLADDYAYYVLGFRWHEISLMKQFAENDVKVCDNDFFIGIFHPTEETDNRFNAFHSLFLSRNNNKRLYNALDSNVGFCLPEYTGLIEMKKCDGYSKYHQRISCFNIMNNTCKYAKTFFFLKCSDNKDDIDIENNLLPVFRYPSLNHKESNDVYNRNVYGNNVVKNGSFVIGFSPLFFDEKIDKELARGNIPYAFAKIYYLATFLHNLTKSRSSLGNAGNQFLKNLANILPNAPEIIISPEEIQNYAFRNIGEYVKEAYNRLRHVTSGLCFGMGIFQLNFDKDSSFDVMLPTKTKKDISITKSLITQINVFLDDWKHSFKDITTSEADEEFNGDFRIDKISRYIHLRSGLGKYVNTIKMLDYIESRCKDYLVPYSEEEKRKLREKFFRHRLLLPRHFLNKYRLRIQPETVRSVYEALREPIRRNVYTEEDIENYVKKLEEREVEDNERLRSEEAEYINRINKALARKRAREALSLNKEEIDEMNVEKAKSEISNNSIEEIDEKSEIDVKKVKKVKNEILNNSIEEIQQDFKVQETEDSKYNRISRFSFIPIGSIRQSGD